MIVAVVLSLLISAWNKQAELVTLTSQISESTPPIASILALFLLLGGAGALGRLARRFQGTGLGRLCAKLIPNRGEILVVFVFLAIGGDGR
jgi:hypothetical protein